MRFLIILAVAAAVALGDRWLKRRHPRVWRKLQLPVCVLSTLLCLAVAVVYGWALWDTWASPVSADDKGFLTVLILIAILAVLFLMMAVWRQYLRDRRSWGEEDAS